jgi:hypothetical protein
MDREFVGFLSVASKHQRGVHEELGLTVIRDHGSIAHDAKIDRWQEWRVYKFRGLDLGM